MRALTTTDVVPQRGVLEGSLRAMVVMAVLLAVVPGDIQPQETVPQLARVPTTLRWGPQRPDLVRYNRVEALSLGVRAQVRPRTLAGPLSVTGTLRLGVADVVPDVHLELASETGRRRVVVQLYHGLQAIDRRARPFAIDNSLLAATIGRDDGDYYRRAGGLVQWTPSTAGRRTFRVRAFVEHHRGASVETDFALFHAGSDTWAFRPNIQADRGWELGGAVDVTPWWGTDPDRPQGGIEAAVRAVAGDFGHAGASLGGRLLVPGPSRFRVDLATRAGTLWGTPSVQRLWYVGGTTSVRGYEPRVRGGESFVTARAELSRGFSFGRISVFSDAGWAGDFDRIRGDDVLRSIGAGLAILDGLVRVDGAWGLVSPRDFRLDVYLDRIL